MAIQTFNDNGNIYTVKTVGTNTAQRYNSTYLSNLIDNQDYQKAANYLRAFTFQDANKQQQLNEQIRNLNLKALRQNTLYNNPITTDDDREALVFKQKFGTSASAITTENNNSYFKDIAKYKQKLSEQGLFDKKGYADIAIPINMNNFTIPKEPFDQGYYKKTNNGQKVYILDKDNYIKTFGKSDYNNYINDIARAYGVPNDTKIKQTYGLTDEEYKKYCYTKNGELHFRLNKNDVYSDIMLNKIGKQLLNKNVDPHLSKYDTRHNWIGLPYDSAVKTYTVNGVKHEMEDNVKKGYLQRDDLSEYIHKFCNTVRDADNVIADYNKKTSPSEMLKHPDDGYLQQVEGFSKNWLSFDPDLSRMNPTSAEYNRLMNVKAISIASDIRAALDYDYPFYTNLKNENDDNVLRPIVKPEDTGLIKALLSEKIMGSGQDIFQMVRGAYVNGQYGVLVTLPAQSKQEDKNKSAYASQYDITKDALGKRIQVFIPGLYESKIKSVMDADSKFEAKNYMEALSNTNGGEYITQDLDYAIKYKNGNYYRANLNNNESYQPISSQEAFDTVNKGIVKTRGVQELLNYADANGKRTSMMNDMEKRLSIAVSHDFDKTPLTYLDGTQIPIDDIFNGKLDKSKLSIDVYTKIINILELFRYYDDNIEQYLNKD